MKNLHYKILVVIVLFSLEILTCSVSAQNDTVVDNRVYMLVPKMPTFPGNLDAYMGDHLQYPELAKSRGIQGIVNVTFVISQTGTISHVAILSGVSPDLDSEAVRVVKNMPPWDPGMKDGKTVQVQFNLPVYFELGNQPNQQGANYRPIDTTFLNRAGIYIDPYIGLGEGGPQSSSATAITLGLSIKSGIGVSIMFPSNIGFSAGLQVQQYKFNYSYNPRGTLNNNYWDYDGTATALRSTGIDTTVNGGYGATVTYSFLYAQLPLLFRYISSQENRLGFCAEAGVVINYLASSQISGTATQTQYLLSQPANSDVFYYASTSKNTQTVTMPSQNPAKLTSSAHAAIGMLIPFTSKISLIVNVSTDVGIMNAGDGSKDIVNFGASRFYIFGNGNYGSFNSLMGEAKLLIKMSGPSKPAAKN